MNIKDAIYNELLTIPKFSGKIGSNEIWLYARPDGSVDLKDVDRKITLVFYRVSASETNSLKNASERFQFDFWGPKEKYADLETARNILKDHFHQFAGILGGGITCHSVEFEYQGDKTDFETGEKCAFGQLTFNYLRPEAGTLS